MMSSKPVQNKFQFFFMSPLCVSHQLSFELLYILELILLIYMLKLKMLSLNGHVTLLDGLKPCEGDKMSDGLVRTVHDMA